MESNFLTYKRIGIVGLGLIGGSLAYRIKAVFPDAELFAVSPNPADLVSAQKERLLVGAFESVDQLPQNDLDLVIIATPLHVIPDAIQAVSKHLTNNVTITDVGSLKKFEVPHLKSGQIFIPGHPMAGSEKSGMANASAELLKDAIYFLEPRTDPRFPKLQTFLETLSFKVVKISPEEHDSLIVLASHLPYFMAALTLAPIADLKVNCAKLSQMIATGFRDTTRVAESPVDWGVDVALQNKANLLPALKSVQTHIGKLIETIEAEDSQGLQKMLSHLKTTRLELYKNTLKNR